VQRKLQFDHLNHFIINVTGSSIISAYLTKWQDFKNLKNIW